MDDETMTRSKLVGALVAHSDSPFGRETLEGMDDAELAAAATATGIAFDDLRRAANAGRDGADGGDLGFEPEGVLTDGPSGGGSGAGSSRPAPGGGLAVHRKSGEGVDLGFETQEVLAGNRGESVLDEEHDGRSANAGDGGDLGFSPIELLSGPRGTSPLDD